MINQTEQFKDDNYDDCGSLQQAAVLNITNDAYILKNSPVSRTFPKKIFHHFLPFLAKFLPFFE